MTRRTAHIVTLALGALLVAPVLAGHPAAAQSSYGGGRPSTYMTEDHKLRADRLKGVMVYNDQGEAIGTVDDVLVDMNGGPPTVVIAVGKFVGDGKKLIAAPLDHLTFGGPHPMMGGGSKAEVMKMTTYTYMPMIEHGSAG